MQATEQHSCNAPYQTKGEAAQENITGRHVGLLPVPGLRDAARPRAGRATAVFQRLRAKAADSGGSRRAWLRLEGPRITERRCETVPHRLLTRDRADPLRAVDRSAALCYSLRDRQPESPDVP